MSGGQKEFHFTYQHFEKVRDIVTAHSGIVLADVKQNMVYSRLVRRLRANKMHSFDDYCALLEDAEHEEFTHFINALTTNLTSFFRENHHFEMLKTKVLPEIMQVKQSSRRIRIWSAGCSTGMEPYSIAMIVKEVIPEKSGWDVKILATDLDTNVLNTAAAGIYEEERVTGVEEARFNRWFRRGSGDNQDKVKVSKKLRDLITFKQLNLLHDFPMSGPIDIIFCRNVVIYFDKETQKKLFDKFAKLQKNGDYLFIGHSENLYNVTKKYKLYKSTLYHKVDD